VCTNGRQGSRPAAAHGVSRTHNNHGMASKITNKSRPLKTNKIQVRSWTARSPTVNTVTFQLQVVFPALYSVTDIRTQRNEHSASASGLCEMTSVGRIFLYGIGNLHVEQTGLSKLSDTHVTAQHVSKYEAAPTMLDKASCWPIGGRKFSSREPLPASSLRLDGILRVWQLGLSIQRETGTGRRVSV